MHLPRSHTFLTVLFLLICIAQPSLSAFWSSSDSIYFCKCMCFSNYTIIPLYRPNDASKPCLSCTKQFCLDQQLDFCRGASKDEPDLDTGTGEEGDVRTKCFQRDSILARTIISLFVIVTVCLLIGAAFKSRRPQRNPRHPQSEEPFDLRAAVDTIREWFYTIKEWFRQRRSSYQHLT